MKNKILLLIALVLSITHQTSSAQTMGWLQDADHIWRVKIAATPASQAQGLMFTPYLPPNSGMLFIFSPAQTVTFWMKNTWLNLDIRFYDKNGKLLTRYPNAQPCLNKSCPLYPSNATIKYVLEIPADSASSAGHLKQLVIDTQTQQIFP